jgi:hypothetical protein
LMVGFIPQAYGIFVGWVLDGGPLDNHRQAEKLVQKEERRGTCPLLPIMKVGSDSVDAGSVRA